MILRFDRIRLRELMRDFYILTGIRIVLYDKFNRKILSYPESSCEFCTIMHNDPATKELCRQSNIRSFEQCVATKELHIYRCHAGLVEATAPIKYNDSVIAYMILGQLTNQKDRARFQEEVHLSCRKYKVERDDLEQAIGKIKYLSDEKIMAASKIMEACASYTLYSGIISIEQEQFLQKLDSYIYSHIKDDIKVETLCREFHVTRTKLYQVMQRCLKGGIATYIREKRVEYAMELLKNTDQSITEIADSVGFQNYNYFCQVFKKGTGLTAKEYRQKYTIELVPKK